LQVSKEGKIFIPVAGQVYVTGIPFEQLQEKIKNLLSKHYSGLSSVPPRTFLDLTVAQLKPVRIFIMGEVESPGGYTVSSASTAFNALYSIGGPLKKGSLREIKVLRNGLRLPP
jgi:protein involved in polysaccharide export with SLBB domain